MGYSSLTRPANVIDPFAPAPPFGRPWTPYIAGTMKKLRVDVWSDIVCPWCYVGKRRLEAALARFPDRDAVQVVWRAFELDPSAPKVREGAGSYSERLAKKYGTTVDQAEKMIRRMTD